MAPEGFTLPLFHKGPAVLIIPYGHLELPRTHLVFGSALARLYVPDDRSPLGDVGYAYSVVDGRVTGRSCNSDVDKRYTPTPYLKPTKSQDAPPPAQDKMTKIDPAKYSLPCIPPPSLNYPPFLSFPSSTQSHTYKMSNPIITQAPAPVSTREARIATHSHIKGLGLADDGSAMNQQGFIGQGKAREALGLHLQLLKMGRHAGRPLLMVGPPGTGKVSQRTSKPQRHQGSP